MTGDPDLAVADTPHGSVRRAVGTASLPAGADGSMLVANLDTSELHRLDRTASAIWAACGDRRPLSDVPDVAARTLGVESSAAFRAACGTFLRQLEDRGLVVVTGADRPTRPPSTGEHPDEHASIDSSPGSAETRR